MYFDRNATPSAAKRRGSAGMHRRSNAAGVSPQAVDFLFLGVGHFLDHLFMLIFATVAALRLADEWGMSYAALIPYAMPGFVAFGLCSIPAGWIADKWSREGMLVIFFIGIGTSSIATALADSPAEIAFGLLAIGGFAAIYHPVGLAMVVHGRKKTGIPLAINGVFGNLGVAVAALLSGYLIDTGGWRNAFVLPGAASIGVGAAYAAFVWRRTAQPKRCPQGSQGFREAAASASSIERATFVSVLCVIVFTTAVGGFIYQTTTFALPKIFAERLTDLAGPPLRSGVMRSSCSPSRPWHSSWSDTSWTTTPCARCSRSLRDCRRCSSRSWFSSAAWPAWSSPRPSCSSSSDRSRSTTCW